tara:strand:+ start:333 stop:767 length:435 start_codon:yes stop_codon:yes gene_type:complete
MANAMKTYGVGLRNVGSFQVSGVPYISGSNAHAKNTERQFNFPTVTKSIKVACVTRDGAGLCPELRIHFNKNGGSSPDVVSGMHDFILSGSVREATLNVKCTELFISAPNAGIDRTYRVYAELTQIPAERMFALTGSGLTTPLV